LDRHNGDQADQRGDDEHHGQGRQDGALVDDLEFADPSLHLTSGGGLGANPQPLGAGLAGRDAFLARIEAGGPLRCACRFDHGVPPARAIISLTMLHRRRNPDVIQRGWRAHPRGTGPIRPTQSSHQDDADRRRLGEGWR
jgi:hypothetical protein